MGSAIGKGKREEIEAEDLEEEKHMYEDSEIIV